MSDEQPIHSASKIEDNMTNVAIIDAKSPFFMTTKQPTTPKFESYYLFNSRILTHCLFWLIYYLAFSLIWAQKHGLFASFYLEFILLPMRIAATYAVLYWLFPQFLLKGHWRRFLMYLACLLITCAVLQRVVIFAFYEELLISSGTGLFDVQAIVRSGLLINTTVMLAMTIKWYGVYRTLWLSSQSEQDKLQVVADRRHHLIDCDQITHISGMGNYVKIHRTHDSPITTYSSIKKMADKLPPHFVRCHRSHLVNTRHIDSFNQDDIHIGGKVIPRGNDVSDEALLA